MHISILDCSEGKLYEEYQNWMLTNGAKFDKLLIKYFRKDYRGLIAKRAIQKDEIIIFVPKELLITVSLAKISPIGKIIIENEASFEYPNNTFLSMFVLIEKSNPNTKWKLLFEAFPKTVDNFPVFFKENEFKLLQGSPFIGNKIHII